MSEAVPDSLAERLRALWLERREDVVREVARLRDHLGRAEGSPEELAAARRVAHDVAGLLGALQHDAATRARDLQRDLRALPTDAGARALEPLLRAADALHRAIAPDPGTED